MIGETNSFKKRAIQYDKKDIMSVMKDSYELLDESFRDFIRITDKITT